MPIKSGVYYQDANRKLDSYQLQIIHICCSEIEKTIEGMKLKKKTEI